MELLNPLMLWGGLAIIIPIILHFWHQKKGKVLEWAATQWLTEKNLQQSRGIRLDNLLLLLLRCILFLLLCFFLSKPIVNWGNAQASVQKIHLVQPSSLVVNNYRFELQEALKKGEKIYWIQANPTPVDDISQLPNTNDFNLPVLQSCLNKLAQTIEKAHLELYFINTQALAQTPHIFIPAPFSLHTLFDSSKQVQRPYLAIGDRKLFVNAANQLSSQPESDKDISYIRNPPVNNLIRTLILNDSKTEKQTIIAALKALAEVYQLNISTDTELTGNQKYDWVFDNKPVPRQSKGFSESALYIISNTSRLPTSQLTNNKNTVYITQRLDPQVSESIFNGELPEWLGEILIKHYGLNPTNESLSEQQLYSLFSYSRYSKAPEHNESSKLILFVFIIILGVERFIAIRKNA